jgi:hypothetical protein
MIKINLKGELPKESGKRFKHSLADLMAYLPYKTDSELAAAIGKTPSLLSHCKKTRSKDMKFYEAIAKLARENGVMIEANYFLEWRTLNAAKNLIDSVFRYYKRNRQTPTKTQVKINSKIGAGDYALK